MQEDCGDWLPELSVVGPGGLVHACGWSRAKFPSVRSWPGGLAVYLGRARECGVRNGHQISMIISYNDRKGREKEE